MDPTKDWELDKYCMPRKHYASGKYILKNPDKYIGRNTPIFRSSWEMSIFSFLDSGNKNIIGWASEPFGIPYHNPITNKQSLYFPDILVLYLDRDGNTRAEVLEIKPYRQTTLENARTRDEKAQALVNTSKWAEAVKFSKNNGFTFRVMTENDLFPQGNKRKANQIRNKYRKRK